MANLIMKTAIDFTANAVLANGTIESNFNLKEAIRGKYGVLFFYPLDFTFVCPTELIALNNRIADFSEINTEVLTVSVDSQYSHIAWRDMPIKNGGIGKVNYTMVADISKNISRSYDVLYEESVALRGTVIIDDNFNVCYQMLGTLGIGRNIDEIIRLIKAAQHIAKHGNVCPAGWNEGKDDMHPSAEGTKDFLNSNEENL